MIWLGWLGCCCCWAAILAATEYSDGEGILSGNRATTTAPAAAGTFADEWRKVRHFLPIRDVILKIGTDVVLLG